VPVTEQIGGNDTGAYQYRVQPTDFSDWAGLHRLLQECFAFMDGRIDPPSSLTRMTPDALREKAGEEILIIVLCADELIACGYLRETWETIYLGKLAVKAGFRGRGILRSMIELAEEIARSRGKSALELQTRVELVENHETFKAVGFVKTGETSHAGYDRPTSITMKKFI
jgi:GNAT superfamily N-acetyltransferase